MSTSTAPGAALGGAAELLGPLPASTPTTWVPPRVNLLPPEVFGRRAVRRVQRGGAAAAAGALLLVVAAWAVGSAQTATEQRHLDEANSRVQALQAEQAQYAAAPQVIKQVDAAEAARALAMGQDVAWYSYVDSLTRALPAGAWLAEVQTSMTSLAASGASPATTGAPTTGASSTGSVSISARSLTYEDVAAYLDALSEVPGVADAYLTSSTQDDSTGTPVITFTVTAQITDEVLTHRYDKDGD